MIYVLAVVGRNISAAVACNSVAHPRCKQACICDSLGIIRSVVESDYTKLLFLFYQDIKGMNKINIKIASSENDIFEAQKVRKQVFQIEQGIDEKLDFDGKDFCADHFLAFLDELAIGTLRVRYPEAGLAKFERLAVSKNFRKMGIGKSLMDFAVLYLTDKNIEKIFLDSQEHAKGFYEKLGFVQEGEVFEEAGIAHVKMYKIL